MLELSAPLQLHIASQSFNDSKYKISSFKGSVHVWSIHHKLQNEYRPQREAYKPFALDIQDLSTTRLT